MGDVVQVARFYDRTEAFVAVGLLESNGILAVAPEEGTLGTNPALSFALGGCRVLVPEEQADVARLILAGATEVPETEKLTQSASWFVAIAALFVGAIPPRRKLR